MEKITFRKAQKQDIPKIWEILQQAIESRKSDGSSQWQDGYPNLSTVEKDVAKGDNYVLIQNYEIIATSALIFNNEPAYDIIDGKWLSNSDFLVVHRIAVSDKVLGQGFATLFFKYFEIFAKENGVFSIKVDTYFDNYAMLKILKKLEYTYCGEILMRGEPRKAFEKILS